MTRTKLNAAISEARRFIARANEALKSQANDHDWLNSSKETGATRRASMDLTRALAELRKPQ